MAPSTTHTSSHSQPAQPQPQPFAPSPGFTRLQDYIQAAASGNRDSLYHLVCAIFALVRAAIVTLVNHYKAHPRAATSTIVARLGYCARRLHPILYTLRHAPERFFTPAQLRALTRARAVLAHMTGQPVDFSPLAPVLAPATASAPSLPRPGIADGSSATAAANPGVTSSSMPAAFSESSLRAPHSALDSSDAPRSALRPSPDPLLLPNPGCALATVLLHIAAIYRVPASPAFVTQPQASLSAAPVAPAPTSGDQPRSAIESPQSPFADPDAPSPCAFHNPPSSCHPPP